MAFVLISHSGVNNTILNGFLIPCLVWKMLVKENALVNMPTDCEKSQISKYFNRDRDPQSLLFLH